MSTAIGLYDIDKEVLRTLLGNRCLRKAGLGIFDSVGRTYTITIAGTVHTGDVITVTIDGTAVPFTITGSETTEDLVATAVAAAIESSEVGSVVAATATLHVVSIVASTTTHAIDVSVAVTGTGHTTTATLAKTVIGATGVETDNAIQYIIDGKSYTKAATTGVETAGVVLPVSSYRWYGVVVDSAGAMTSVAGSDNVNKVPDIPSGKTLIGAYKVTTDSTHTFTPGTTGLAATGITASYYDLSCIPKNGYPA